ncbi:hypothetical protein BFW01_g2664 [Lasiodiplodia theobromae]|uniref:EF-hand domain-containing protein n=1 Tax=Lasiodiplodia theobromae TaxID=45133 RepID=A0A5N5D7I9_9PEZI|nr:hypothetical protein DBV05_g7764 [Lasiodiplodia theobromae]KAF9631802.1 hypothetical protein BFW01_g2664 [Lasiodiplodia theobromae]
MEPDKDKDKTLSLGEIKAMLEESEQQEQVAHKRATKAAKRFAKLDLTAEEEDFATSIRKQLANFSGYLYKPEYQYAHLRTEPPCTRPEYSEYTKKQMREAEEAEEKQKKAANEAETDTKADKIKDDGGVPTKKEVEDAAEALIPNIQRLSMLADSDSSDDDDVDTIIHRMPSKSSDGGSVITTILDGRTSKLASTKEPPTVKPTTALNNTPFDPDQPVLLASHEAPTLNSYATGPRSSTSSSLSQMAVDHEAGRLHSGDRVHPWPNLWPDYMHKPPQLDQTQWTIINANLGSLGAAKDGAIDPCDEENRQAYEQIQEVLEVCWLVMTGQLSPIGNITAQNILKPILQKEKPDMKARLKVYEEKLTLRRIALNLPGGDWKRLSGESGKSDSFFSTPSMGTPSQVSSTPLVPCSPAAGMGGPFPAFANSPSVATDHFSSTPASPSTSKRSSSNTNKRSSASSDKRSSTHSDTKPLVSEADSKNSSAHTSFDGHSGAQTPSKRGKLALITSAFKVPKSPKKSTKSWENSGAVERQIVTTPRDAPPVPTIPAPFSGQNTPQTSFETAVSSTNTPSLTASPTIPSLNRKPSRSFAGTPSSSMAGPTSKKYMSFDGYFSAESDEQKAYLASGSTVVPAQPPAGKVQSASFRGTPGGRKTPTAIREPGLFSPRADTPATMKSTDLDHASVSSRYTPNVSTTDLSTTKRSRKHSRASSGASTRYNVFDAHLEELLSEFNAWADGQDASMDDVSKDPERPNVKEILKPLDYEEIRRLNPSEHEAMVNEVKKIMHADLRAQVLKEHHDARFPSGAPGHRSTSFAALPYLALRIARWVLDAVNESFLPSLKCAYEIENYQFAEYERRWRVTHPGGKTNPFSGVSRPADGSYLRPAYAAAWATRFVQWAEEQQQLWKYENVDLPTMNEYGGGFRRPGRTMEAKFLLNMVNEKINIDRSTGDLEIEGDGAMLKDDEVQRRFEKLARREQRKGTKKVWAACEEQIKRLSMMMDVVKAERPASGVVSGRSSPEDGLSTYHHDSTLAYAGLLGGI